MMEAAPGSRFDGRDSVSASDDAAACEIKDAFWESCIQFSPAEARPDALRPIPAGGLGAALPVLRRGFPDRDGTFWEQGFARLGAGRRDGPIGYLLGSGGEDVGVLLTFRSERFGPDGSRTTVVNLAGWTIDPEHRWKAPMMLRRVVADRDAVFTDLTPSGPVERINTALGFALWNQGEVVTFLPPWASLPAPADVAVTAAADDPAALAGDGDLVARHAAMGCIAAVLRVGDRASPMLFTVMRRRGLRVARLVYAENRRAVLANRTAIGRFLVTRGVIVLTVDADRADCPRGSVFREGRRKFVTAGLDRDRVDYAFSELVLLDLSTQSHRSPT